MAGFSSLNIGVLGLQAAQTSLNTTAHNLANAYTEGYVKQTAVYSDYRYVKVGQYVNGNMLSGLGVYVNATSRVRDILIDKAYREETGREGFYSAQYKIVEEIETILGELEGTTFQQEIEDMWKATAELAKDPGNDVARSEFVMAAETFLGRATSIYTDLVNYQKTLDTEVKNSVQTINDLGKQIKSLNDKINAVEANGIERANDLRDQRDVALDKLANLVKISYSEESNGIVSVKAEGVPFVTTDAVFFMDTAELSGAKGSTYVSAVWPQLDGERVFNLTEEIATSKKNDIGKLKGILLARGEYIANYTDVPKAENFATSVDYEAAVKTYNEEIENCAIMKAQALFDNLINGIVTSVNDTLSPLVETTVAITDLLSGTVYPPGTLILDENNSAYGDDGQLPAEEIFSRADIQRYTQIQGTDGNTYYIYNHVNTFGSDSLYTCSNLTINQAILEDYTKIPMLNREGESDMKKGESLMKIWEETFSNLDPGSLTKRTFKDYYNEYVYEIGNMGDLYLSISKNQGTAVSNLETSRQAVMGVSSEEELSNMIKYQSAYGAASRYINVIDEILEHLVTKL